MFTELEQKLILKYEQVLQQPEARKLGGRVVGGVTQRLGARFLMQLLGASTTASK
jgi:aarF domain-containing kinase